MQSNDALQKYAKEVHSISPPPPRFGHTVNFYTSNYIVLFGGAINIQNDKGSFLMTSDLYFYNISQASWKKLGSDKKIKARAAHASANKNDVIIYYYGGLSNKGQFADDNLWTFKMKNNNESLDWVQIETTGQTPGPRYGHSMELIHNNLFLCGGSSISGLNEKAVVMNDIWICNADKKWIKLYIENNPLMTPRLYHTLCVYKKINRDNDTIVLFGGRDSHNKPLNDLLSLTKIGRDNNYIWEIHSKKKGNIPISRYEHSSVMFGPFLFIIGGKSTHSKSASFDIFSFISYSWYNFGNVYLYRHTTWIYLNYSNLNDIKLNLYIYGGFDAKHNNELNTKFLIVDVIKLFSEKEELKTQLNNYLLILKNNNIIEWNANIDPTIRDPNNNLIFRSYQRNENNYTNINFTSKDDKIVKMLDEKIISEDFLEKNEIKNCLICLEDYSVGKYISYLPCCHFFHSVCIKKWLYKSKKCPLCKTDVINE